MKQDKSKTVDLLAQFRESRNQVLQRPVENSAEKVKNYKRPDYKPRPHNNVSSDNYSKFLFKYEHLEDYIDEFKTQDLMYFFREKAREEGVKYVISNMKRDMGIFKKLQESYEVKEICLMIEFLFCSNQNYLVKPSLQPTILVSNWCNKIYNDSLLWVDDKYSPEENKKSNIKKREWQKQSDGESATIGEWE